MLTDRSSNIQAQHLVKSTSCGYLNCEYFAEDIYIIWKYIHRGCFSCEYVSTEYLDWKHLSKGISTGCFNHLYSKAIHVKNWIFTQLWWAGWRKCDSELIV